MIAPPPKRTVDPSRRLATVSSVRSRISMRDPSSIITSAPESFAVRTGFFADTFIPGRNGTSVPDVSWYRVPSTRITLSSGLPPKNGAACHAV